MSVQTIGVVGGGIGGLAAAWLLDGRYRVTLLEANDYLGGNTRSVMVDDPRGAFSVDTGFMVFNRRSYPLLCALLAHLGVDSHATERSFAVSLDGGRLEYAGSGLDRLFGQRSNLASPGFLHMLVEILRFGAAARRSLERERGDGERLSLGDFLARGGYSERFANHYLLPLAAATWARPAGQVRNFPFSSFARFFDNHGLLDIVGRSQWQSVRGGSHLYAQTMLSQMRAAVRTGVRVARVRRLPEGVELELVGGERMRFDALVLGCHADQALGMIESPTQAEREILSAFSYGFSRVVVHQDPDLMPKRRRVWASWNYLQGPTQDPTAPVTLTYWMNSLQDLPPDRDVFVSLNPATPPRPETVLREIEHRHPVFDNAALAAQARIGEIQGRDRIWLSAAWLGDGFHEAGLRAAVEVAAGLGVGVPWSQGEGAGHPAPAPSAATRSGEQ